MKVVYWSSTGNTERMAEMLGEEIKNAGGEAEVCELSTVSPADLDVYKRQEQAWSWQT